MFSTWCPDLSLNFDAQILYGYIARERLSVGKRANKGGGGRGPRGGGGGGGGDDSNRLT